MAEAISESQQIERLEGQISAYQTFVVNVMKLNLSDEQIDGLVHWHAYASVPPVSTYKQVGIKEGDAEILRLIKNNRDRHRE